MQRYDVAISYRDMVQGVLDSKPCVWIAAGWCFLLSCLLISEMRRHRHCQWCALVVYFLLVLPALVRPENCSVPRHQAGRDDNEQFPIGDRVAIFMVGLTVPVTSTLVLPSLAREILQPFGADRVDVFVHTSPLDAPSSGSEEDIVKIHSSVLKESLAAIVVDSDFKALETVHVRNPQARARTDRQATPSHLRCQEYKCDPAHPHFRFCDNRKFTRLASAEPGWEAERDEEEEECMLVERDGTSVWLPRIWEPPANFVSYLQFFRLRAVFPLLLAEERRRSSRYSHVVRMRTDSVWYTEWVGAEGLLEGIPPHSSTVAVPAGHLLHAFWGDTLWIASRAAARSVFVGFVDLLEQPVDRKELLQFFGCRWQQEGHVPIAWSRQEDECFTQVVRGAASTPYACIQSACACCDVACASCDVSTASPISAAPAWADFGTSQRMGGYSPQALSPPALHDCRQLPVHWPIHECAGFPAQRRGENGRYV